MALEFHVTCDELRSRAIELRRGAAAQGFDDRAEAAELDQQAELQEGREKNASKSKAGDLRKRASEKVNAALAEADELDEQAANRHCN